MHEHSWRCQSHDMTSTSTLVFHYFRASTTRWLVFRSPVGNWCKDWRLDWTATDHNWTAVASCNQLWLVQLLVAQFAKNQKDQLWTGCNRSFWGPVAWPMIPPSRGICPISFLILSIYLNLLEYFLLWLLQKWHTMRNRSYPGPLWTKSFDFWICRRPGASSIFHISISKRGFHTQPSLLHGRYPSSIERLIRSDQREVLMKRCNVLWKD